MEGMGFELVLKESRSQPGEEEFQEEPLKHSFEGINVREFILFDGEALECFTEELEEGQTVRVSDHRLLTGKGEQGDENSRFGLINRMARAKQDGDMKTALEALDTYRQLDYLTKEIFTLI